jgi:hypothetical protein
MVSTQRQLGPLNGFNRNPSNFNTALYCYGLFFSIILAQCSSNQCLHFTLCIVFLVEISSHELKKKSVCIWIVADLTLFSLLAPPWNANVPVSNFGHFFVLLRARNVSNSRHRCVVPVSSRRNWASITKCSVFRTMALGSTQPLTEMSTRNLPGANRRPTGA